MADVELKLEALFTPAFHELMNTAEAIKQRHGEERAIAWAQKALELDFDLFCDIRAARQPMLRLIEGGLG